MKSAWLYRKPNGEIKGPWSQAELLQFLEQGVYSEQDEISPSLGYWFFLHETAEVKRQLGIDLSPPKGGSGSLDHTDTKIIKLEVKPEPTPVVPTHKNKPIRPARAASRWLEKNIENTPAWKWIVFALIAVTLLIVVFIFRTLGFSSHSG